MSKGNCKSCKNLGCAAQNSDWTPNPAVECFGYEPLTNADRIRAISEYERGEFDVLDLLSSAWHGKQYYFMQDNGVVYSRDSCEYMRLDDAISEFAEKIGDDGSI